MRLPRLRITVLGLMVFIALIGTFMGGTMMGLRLGHLSEEYQRRSVKYIQDEEGAAYNVQTYEKETAWIQERVAEKVRRGEVSADRAREGIKLLAKRNQEAREKLEPFIRYRQKYERAAAYPWLPVAPDPPSPETLALAFAKKIKAKDANEATAIYQAACGMETIQPGFLASKPTVSTSGNAYAWTVTFTDPKTGTTKSDRTYFALSSVKEYMRLSRDQQFK
jgi:hypothetical protein